MIPQQTVSSSRGIDESNFFPRLPLRETPCLRGEKCGLAGFRDKRARAKIATRFLRLAGGNFGDCKPLKEGVWEIRIDHGPGYRVYYAMIDKACVLLLCGGDKRKQAADIERAVEYWNDYRRRTRKT